MGQALGIASPASASDVFDLLAPSATEPKTIQSDMCLVRRAIRDGWDVPEKMRSWLPEAIIEVITLPHAKSGLDEWTLDRNAIAGARTILAMTAENMQQEHAERRRLLAEYESKLRLARK